MSVGDSSQPWSSVQTGAYESNGQSLWLNMKERNLCHTVGASWNLPKDRPLFGKWLTLPF